jgi:purine-binding chemotaxis protein CheW
MNTEQLVVFTLDGEAYGLPITRVQEIIRYTTPRAVPDADRGIRGVICLRSKVIPVVDTRELLGVFPAGGDEHANVVIVDSPVGPCGLIVDAVTEVIRIDCNAIDTDSGTRVTRGIAQVGEQLLVVIDVDQLLPSFTDSTVDFAEAA